VYAGNPVKTQDAGQSKNYSKRKIKANENREERMRTQRSTSRCLVNRCAFC
jgi:hypothetical protein